MEYTDANERPGMHAPARPYGPSAVLGEPDLRMPLGGYIAEFFASEIKCLGLIRYLYIVRIVDAKSEVAFYLTAETNPLVGPNAVFIGRFLENGHATLASDPAFADPAVFIWKAMEKARAILELDEIAAPPSDMERAAIERARQFFADARWKPLATWIRWGLAALLLALTTLLWAAEATYAGPSARAADAWTHQSHSVTGRFLAWARASGRGVPDQVWVLTGASAEALRQWEDSAADRPRGGPVMPAEEDARCRREVPGFPDFESLCRARFGHLRWQRVANILSAGTWKYSAGKVSAEATWMDGALRAARSQQKVHVAGRAVWIALPTVEAQEANCGTECDGVLALADALSRLWQRDAGSDGESVLGETIPGAWPPNSSTWQRIRAVKAALTASAFLGISPAPLLRDYARYAEDLPSRRRIERAAGKLEALFADEGREWALSPNEEAQIAVRIGIAVLTEELPPDLPSGAEEQAMAAQIADIAARRPTDNSAPEVQFFDWLEQRELDVPSVAGLPDAVTGKTPVCRALAPLDASGLLRHACEYRQFSERIRSEHDIEMLDYLRNRRVFELKGWFRPSSTTDFTMCGAAWRQGPLFCKKLMLSRAAKDRSGRRAGTGPAVCMAARQ